MNYQDYYYSPLGSGPQDEGFLHDLASVALPPLVWLGQTLDKPGRALRGLLGGQGPEALLNLIPLSDTIGWTDPNKSVSGRDLGRQWGWMNQEDTTGNFWGGLGLEIALDPINFLTLGTKGTLTAVGKADKLKDALAPTMQGRIAAGQSGLMGVRSPWYYDFIAKRAGLPYGSAALMTGPIGETAAGWLGRMGERATESLPGVAKLRAAFSPGLGWTGHREVVPGFAAADTIGVQHATEAKLLENVVPLYESRGKAYDLMQQAGMAPADAEDAFAMLVNAAAEGSFPMSPLYRGADPIARGALHSQVAPLAQGTASQLRDFYDDLARPEAMASGVKIGELSDPFTGYLHHRGIEARRKLTSQSAERTVPRPLLGGTNEIAQLMQERRFTLNASGQIAPGDYIYGGIARAKQTGVPFDTDAVKAQIAQNAETLAQREIVRRDFLLQNPALTDEQEKFLTSLTDDAIHKRAGELARWMADQDPEIVNLGRGAHRPDPVGNAVEYALNVAKLKGTAEGVLATLARSAKPAEETLKAATDAGEFVRLGDALDDLNLNAAKTGSIPMPNGKTVDAYEAGGRVRLIDELAGAGKISVLADLEKDVVNQTLKEWVVPKELKEALAKELKGAPIPDLFGPGRAVDWLTSLVRTGVTVPFPAYHVRNTWEGLLQQGLAGSFSPKAQREVLDYLSGSLTDKAKIAEMGNYMKEAFAHGAAGRHQVLEFLGKSMAGEGAMTASPLVKQTGQSKTSGATGFLKKMLTGKEGETWNPLKPDKFIPFQRGIEARSFGDDFLRLSQFVAMRRQGYTPAAAAKAVRQSQLDYSLLSDAEKTYMRNLIPFYSFSRRNLSRLAGQVSDPGPLASLIRAGTSAGRESTVPSHVSTGASIPIPGAEEGKQRYLAGFSLPFEDEIFRSLTALASGQPETGARGLLAAANPLLKTAVELGTGRQLFTGRRLEDLQPSPVYTAGGVLPNQAGIILQELLQATPMSRALSSASSAIETKDRNPALMMATGVRTRDIDPQLVEKYAAKDALERLLMRSGYGKRHEQVYIPAKAREAGEVPPEVLYLMELLGEIQKR